MKNNGKYTKFEILYTDTPVNFRIIVLVDLVKGIDQMVICTLLYFVITETKTRKVVKV